MGTIVIVGVTADNVNRLEVPKGFANVAGALVSDNEGIDAMN